MNCETAVCKGDNRKGGCQCYSFGGDYSKQVCAREIDGKYHECEAGCCHNGRGCPGQCRGVSVSPPFRSIPNARVITSASKTHHNVMNVLVLTMIAIAMMRLVVSIGALFKNRVLKTSTNK